MFRCFVEVLVDVVYHLVVGSVVESVDAVATVVGGTVE